MNEARYAKETRLEHEIYFIELHLKVAKAAISGEKCSQLNQNTA